MSINKEQLLPGENKNVTHPENKPDNLSEAEWQQYLQQRKDWERIQPTERQEVREIKNNLAIDGTIDNAFKAAIGAEPDALHAILVELAHASVDATIEALKDKK